MNTVVTNPGTIRAAEDTGRDRLRWAQAETLATPRRRYGPATRLLITGMDTVYGR